MESNSLIILIPISFIFAMAFIVKVISDNRVRHQLIEKGMVEENIKYLYAYGSAIQRGASLKWGIFLVAIGSGLLLINLLPGVFYDESAFGVLLIFGGLALFVHYFIANKMTGNAHENQG